jgi:hypothetical protein
MLTALLLVAGCDYGFTLPSTDPKPGGPTIAGQKLPIRLRRGLLPGTVTGPPPPDPGLSPDQCGTLNEGGGLQDDCVTAEVHCGETIIGHTRGGTNRFNTRFYEANFCTPATTQHDGGDERVYILDLPDPQTRALVYLDTPCANLDLAALKYSGDTCPSNSSNLPQCEMFPKDGKKREKLDLYNNDPTRWWIVVEGQGEEEGAFALTVQCIKW